MLRINTDVSVETLREQLQYLECPVTVAHALIHLKSAITAGTEDLDQLEHDIDITHSIIKVLASSS